MKYFLSIIALLLLMNFSSGQSPENESSTEVESMIQSRNFDFVAESANPMRGRSIFLSPGYTFQVRPDSLVSYLPYYGRAYQATMDPSSAGIKFTSTDFEYFERPRRKRGWEIQLRPKDVHNSPQVHLSINDNGHASLRVTMIDRQSISFQGYIRQKSTQP
jgi:hypothetical protein